MAWRIAAEQSRARARADGARAPFEDDFDAAWRHYPRKLARKDALSKYQARRREGLKADVLLRATINFAGAMLAEDRPKDKIMYGATFYGPHERWRDYEHADLGAADPADDRPDRPVCPEHGPAAGCVFNVGTGWAHGGGTNAEP